MPITFSRNLGFVSEPATKEDVAQVRDDVAQLRASTKEDLAQVRDDVAQVRDQLAQVRDDVAQLRASTKEDLAQVRDDVAQLRASTKEDLAQAMTQLRGEMGEMERRLNRSFEENASRIAKVMMEHIQGLATIVDEKYKDLPGRHAELRADVDTHVADVRLHARRPTAPAKRARRPRAR
jgi:DNA anti-recombination protein RmuC